MNRVLVSALLLAIGLLSPLNSLGEGQKKESSFDLGRRNYESGNYSRALDLFSSTISSTSDPAVRNKAFYFQGLTYFEMGLYYSSYISFRNVLLAADDRNREIYEKAIKNAVIIADRLNMVDRIGKVIDKLPPNLIPSSVSGISHYAVGAAKYEANENSEAESHFKSVNPQSQFYDKALYHLGIIATRRKDYKEAAIYFEKILELTHGKRDLFWLQELARLNLARTVYSAGDIERSVELYSQFLSSSKHWLTVLLEASWPLMRINDTTVSLGNLHTITSPFYREDLVGEAYILRATILFNLCKYEEMRRTLSAFFNIYDPVMRAMQTEAGQYASADAMYRVYASGKGLNRSFMNFISRDEGIQNNMKVMQLLKEERFSLAKYPKNEQNTRMAQQIDEAEGRLATEIGTDLNRIHRRRLAELQQQREQANYLKVEIVTGEKDLIEGQKGLPPKRVVDVETTVAPGYRYWPFNGEYWEDELGTYIYTTESSCVN